MNEREITDTRAADRCDFCHRLESPPSALALGVKQVKTRMYDAKRILRKAENTKRAKILGGRKDRKRKIPHTSEKKIRGERKKNKYETRNEKCKATHMMS